MRERQINFDLLRLLLAFMVIVLHISAGVWIFNPDKIGDFKIATYYNNMVRSTVPIFFMLSGYFSMGKDFDFKKNINKAIRIFSIFVIWSFIYGLLAIKGQNNLTFKDILGSIIVGKYHLWFLSTLVWCYLFLPMAYALKEFKSGKYLSYMMLMFFLTGICKKTLVDYLQLTEHYLINSFIAQFGLYYIVEVVYFFILGYYIGNLEIKLNKIFLIFIFIASGIINGFLTNYYSIAKGLAVETFISNFNILVFLSSISIFILFKNLSNNSINPLIKKFATKNSNTMMGIYILHPLIIDIFNEIGFKLTNFPLSYGIFLYSFLVFVVSLLISKIFLKIPLIKILLT